MTTSAASHQENGNPDTQTGGISGSAPWIALIIIVLAQLQMGINVNALPVSLGPISEDLDVSATAVATALVIYSLCVAAFVMPGAKIGLMFGERRVFQSALPPTAFPCS